MTMQTKDYKTTVKVGLFLLVGLLAVGGTVAYFGRFGEAFKSTYEIHVIWDNAANLLKGAKVQLAGAKIGTVGSAPRILSNMQGVSVTLNIYSDVKIPTKSDFFIASSGLLGDKFVDVVVNDKTSEPLTAECVIQGVSQGPGLDEVAESATQLAAKAISLASNAEAVIADVQTVLQNINSITEKLDKELLDSDTLASLRNAIANVETASKNFSEVSQKADDLLTRADAAVGEAQTIFQQAQGTVTKADTAIGNINATFVSANFLIRNAQQGKGALGMLMNDPQVSQDLQSFVKNLRSRGVLWYKDRDSDKTEPESRSEPKKKR